jgi:hypothetical protein
MSAMRIVDRDPPGKIHNFETMLIDKAGNRIPAAISGSIIRDASGAELATIGFAKDLRDIRKR